MRISDMSCPEGEARLDRFHDGAFALYQPVGRGFRAGLDAMLLGACVPSDFEGCAVDLGAGTGAVGFSAASRAPGLRVTLAETLPELAVLLRASIEHPGNARLRGRLSVSEVDLLGGRGERERGGLFDGRFDLVLTNPPFYPSDHRGSPDPVRRAALSSRDPAFLGNWLKASAALAGTKGRLALVARPQDLPQIAAALQGRLGALCVVPVHTRTGPAKRILVGARKGSRAGLSILPALHLSEGADEAADLTRAIAGGRHSIDLFPSGL